jgi:glycosyltransferase involved in cell wall biosynthesis
MRPRHCMVVYAYYPHTETRVQRQAEALVARGFDVDVVCLRADGEQAVDTYRGVRIHRLPMRTEKRSLARQMASYLAFLARATVRVTRLSSRHRYDSVQVHNLPDFLVFCAVVPKLHRVPVILDLHDLMPEFFSGRFGVDGGRLSLRRLATRAIAWQERCACRFADHVITVSDHWRETLVRRGVDRRKCSVVMNVADTAIFRPIAASGKHCERFELVYHGSVTYRYGLDLALAAVAELAPEIPEIHLTVLGRGDLMTRLVAQRRELGITSFVDLRDEYVVAEELPAMLAGATLGVVPYRNDVFTDGLLPTKLMEYAVMGIPSVAARTSAMQTYFTDTMVEFFEPGDAHALACAIRRLHADPARRSELARGSRRFTDRYSWERLGRQYVGLVEHLQQSA